MVKLNYVQKENATHVSYGSKKGNFILDDQILKLLSESDYYLKNFCFVEIKTLYYVLMFDFDFHSTHTNAIEYCKLSDEIVNEVVFNINKILKKIFVKPDVSYVYCDKNIDKGVHLYYPNIVVNEHIHQYIYNDVLIELIGKNKFNLSGENWKNIFDACITKANGLRFPYFYKDSTYYKINETLSTFDIPLTRYEKIKLCCIRTDLISEKPKLKIEIKQTSHATLKQPTKKIKTIITNFTEPQVNKVVEYICITELDGILSCFQSEMFSNYKDWFTMGWFIFNCNNTEEACKLFYKYSKTGNYTNVTYEHIKQKFYEYKINNYFNPNILRYQARKENPKSFDKLQLNIDYNKKEFESIQFCDEKLIDINNSSNTTFILNEYEKYNDSDHTFFMLKSPYGTGKTTMIEHICKTYGYEKILFITHRQSLANDFDKSFGKIGFYNYLNKSNFSPNEDRLIVNIDSLYLLKEAYNFFTEKSNLKEFDLVILDECESLLKHFESSLLNTNKDYIYSIFHDLISNTKKVICMDGDLSNRSFNYFRRFDQNIRIYENTHITRQYNFIIGYDEISYVNSIRNDLENGLNVAVVSMSADFCEKINKIFSNDYATFIIVGKSDDSLKKQLKNSESLLKTKRLFIYSPCITVGVDINFKHFNKIYGFVCNKSVTARDFMQMLARIRDPSSSNIYLLMDKAISRSQIANYYEYEEIKLIYAHKYNYNPNDLTTYQVLRLWNKFEDLNNQLYLFAVLLYYIKHKGHTYEIKDEKSYKKFENFTMVDIVGAKSIDEDEYEELIQYQKNGTITQQQRLSIEKFLYSKVFKIDIDCIDIQFMKLHYGKLDVVYKNKYMQDYLNTGIIEIHNEHNVFDDQLKCEKMEYVKTMINKLGFNKVDDKVTKLDFETNVVEMLKIIDDKFRLAFKMNKEEVDNLNKKYETNKKMLGFINSLLGQYGLWVKFVQKTFYNKDTCKQNCITVGYKLENIKIIKQIIKN